MQGAGLHHSTYPGVSKLEAVLTELSVTDEVQGHSWVFATCVAWPENQLVRWSRHSLSAGSDGPVPWLPQTHAPLSRRVVVIKMPCRIQKQQSIWGWQHAVERTS